MDDEDRNDVPMTADERTAWAYLVTVVVTSGCYLALMAVRLLDQPVEAISWVGPMLWTLGASITGTVGATVMATVAGASRCAPGTDGGAVTSDVRDLEIKGRGDRASMGVLAAGFGVALILTMIDADTFWIGNELFLFGTAGAVVETTTKIRLYRRGF